MRALPRLAAAALSAAALAGCVAFGGSSAPSVNGDTPIATLLDAPRGSPSDFDVNVGRRVFFAPNSAELSDTGRVTLDGQAAWLKRFLPYRIVIEGHADEPGSAAANLDLGRRRAAAVEAYLVRPRRRGGAPEDGQLRQHPPGAPMRRRLLLVAEPPRRDGAGFRRLLTAPVPARHAGGPAASVRPCPSGTPAPCRGSAPGRRASSRAP